MCLGIGVRPALKVDNLTTIRVCEPIVYKMWEH
jgi:hypothetical protein